MQRRGTQLPQDLITKRTNTKMRARALTSEVVPMVAQNELLKAIGRSLRGRDEDIAREALPQRWVDLILYLNEQERKREQQAETKARRRPH
jgi:hypothetical protein